MTKKIIIFDLDGTLANIEHRRHFVTDPGNDGSAGMAGVYERRPPARLAESVVGERRKGAI